MQRNLDARKIETLLSDVDFQGVSSLMKEDEDGSAGRAMGSDLV